MQERSMELMSQANFSTEFSRMLWGEKLFESRSVYFSEAVSPATAERVVANLLLLDQASQEPIYLYLNSPGGEINSGFAIYDTIRYIDSDVYVITNGLCASIATIINIAVDKSHRISLPNSKFLIHQPLIGGTVQGSASDLEITATQILKAREKINHLLAKECGQELSRIEKDAARDYWMNAEEALEYGLIGRIIEKKSDL